MSFRTYDKMIMYRWIYVFHDLIAKGKRAEELPTLINKKIPSCIFYIGKRQFFINSIFEAVYILMD